jgi:polar amino acid transport system permease protein
MEDFLYNFANLETLVRVWPLLLQGFIMTCVLGVVVVVGGAGLGLVIAMLHGFGPRWLKPILIVWVDFFRAFPPIVLLLFIYYGLPALGIDLPAFAAAVIGLSLNSSGYYGEIFRAGIEGIARGQTEAARSTGLSRFQALFWVVLPQGIRNVVPPLTTNTLEVIKNTSIASVVTLQELLKSARTAEGLVFNPTPLVAAAVIYFLLLWPLVRVISALNRREIARHG